MYDLGKIDRSFIENVIYCEQADSTNNAAKAYAMGSSAPALFIAERQTAGRGRSGADWETFEGDALAFTLLLFPNLSADKAALLSLLTGLAVCEALTEYCGGALIKWPNDVLINGKKVCGILAETARSGAYAVGIGVNVNNAAMPPLLRHKATSMYIESGAVFGREAVLNDILREFRYRYEKFLRGESFVADYKKRCANLGRMAYASLGGKEITGVAADVADNGRLIIEAGDGARYEIHSGDVAVYDLY